MIGLILAVWVPLAFVGAVLICRHFALRRRYERIWQGVLKHRAPRWDVTTLDPGILSYHDAQLLRQHRRTQAGVRAARERLAQTRT